MSDNTNTVAEVIKTENTNTEIQNQGQTTAVVSTDSNSLPENAPDKDINWKKFKEARDLDRKRAEEMTKKAAEKEAEALALKAAMEAILNKGQQHQNYSNNNNYAEDEDTEEKRIEKKVDAALRQREERYQQERAQREQEELPQRLNKDFQDFDNVCSTTNLDYLEYHYPEVASAFAHMPNGYNKWASIYKAVKRFIPNTDAKKDQVKAEKNMAKPQSISSPTITQSGTATTMSSQREIEARRAENFARMKKLIHSVKD